MLRIAVGAIATVAVLVTAGPAAARGRYLSVPVSVHGGISASWHGDPARGCADAGLCGYRGSLTAATAPGSESESQIDLFHGQLRGFDFSLIGDEQQAVVRVLHDRGGSTDGCADVSRDTELTAAIEPAGPGRVRLEVGSAFLSSGRCAGPRSVPGLRRLRGRVLSLSELRRRSMSVSLAGRVPYASGRFSGTVVSTLRVRVGPVVPARIITEPIGPDAEQGPNLGARRVNVQARYVVQSLTGSFTTSFAGVPGPGCDILDACGVSGHTAWGLIVRGGHVFVDADAPARASERGLRGAISAIRRGRGYVSTEAGLRHASGTVSAEVLRAGMRDCADTTHVRAPALGAEDRSDHVSFKLADPYSGNDFVRTGCGGPTNSDVVGAHAVAAATLPPSVLARRALEVDMRGSGKFSVPGYTGSRDGRFTLVLRRVGLKVAYSGGRG